MGTYGAFQPDIDAMIERVGREKIRELMKAQRPLDEEQRRALYQNIWELYEDSGSNSGPIGETT